MFLLIYIFTNLTLANDIDFSFQTTFSKNEIDLSYIRKIDATIEIKTDYPSFDGRGILDMSALNIGVRVFLSPTGSTSASLETAPRLYYTGEDICDVEITNIDFRFIRFQSRLPNSWDKSILKALKNIDSLDPELKKPLIVDFINDKLRETISDYCFGPLN
ncbi:MAG: hypothetical protein OEY33_07080 [Bdellovibrionales bacterium]|jgi:hypothetical protein|nr:hypothetical protein [Bdellovibrionales bacterium]